jgi:hypothetical protein
MRVFTVGACFVALLLARLLPARQLDPLVRPP